jgi:transcriptional regulator with XRE-family HTH domain
MWYYFFINIKEVYKMRIKDLREDKDLTQQEVANYLHIKQNTYSQYENGQRQLPISCLIALAKLYKTSTDYILGLTDNKTPYA